MQVLCTPMTAEADLKCHMRNTRDHDNQAPTANFYCGLLLLGDRHDSRVQIRRCKSEVIRCQAATCTTIMYSCLDTVKVLHFHMV